MSKEEELGMHEQVLVGGAGQHRRVAHVPHMVRATGLIQKQVPVNPAGGSCIEVAHDVMGITLTKAPVAFSNISTSPPAVSLIASFCGEQGKIWKRLTRPLHVAEVVPGVPMKSNSLNKLPGSLVA